MVLDRLRDIARTLQPSVRSGPPTVAFLHPGRCGSTVVGTMFGRRPDAVWDGELFEPSRRDKVPEAGQGREPAEVIQIRRRQRADLAYAFAFKYTPSHHLGLLGLTMRDLLTMLEEAGVDHYVVVRRRNYLRRVVSGAVGRERGAFHQRRDAGPVELTRVRLDPEAVPFGPDQPLFDVFDELERAESELADELGQRRHLWLTYEDHIESDPSVAYAMVCEFIGLPSFQQEVPLRRTTPFPLHEVLTNHEEIIEHLSGTRYEWMLDDAQS